MSRIYFSLRSNAHALVGGAPALAVVRRVKLAGLLHDEVLVEDGVWNTQAGPTGSYTLWHPATGEHDAAWQTGHERHLSRGKVFMVAMKPDSAPPDRPAHPVIQSSTSVNWRATFEPMKREVPRAYPWLRFGHVDDTPSIKAGADDWSRLDERDQALVARFPVQFERGMVIKSVNLDLLLASGLQSAVSMDARHSSIARARLMRGEARPAFGWKALEILLPDAGARLSWEDVDSLREHSAIRELRTVYAEIEQAAMSDAQSLDDFERAVHREYARRLREAADRTRSNFPSGAVTTILSAIIGEVVNGLLGGLPLAGTVASATVGLAANKGRPLPAARWISADLALRRRAG